jgi:peptide/nickel transport system substrate-binding protein
VLDAPGPWGTGPFTLTEGYSSLVNSMAVISGTPFAATWLDVEQPRTPRVVLEANRGHWNTERGPRMARVVYRNDLSAAEALEAVCDREGEVDILGEVSPADAGRVKASLHADLVSVDAMRVLVAMINRGAPDVPLADLRARQALNLAVDRDRLIREGFAGHASPLAGFTPRFASGVPAGLTPYPHEPARARELLQAAGWPAGRPLRLAATSDLAELARLLAGDFEKALGLQVDVIVPPAEQVPALTRQLVEKRLTLPWDLHLHPWIDLSADAPPAMLHREFIGATGAFRTGPVVDEFDQRFERYAAEVDLGRFTALAEEMDQLCYDQALAVFLCSPKALYAVNSHVRFVAHRATFELAETEVDEEHWSRQTADGAH